MSELARQLIAAGKVVGPTGKEHSLISATGLAQCEFLADLIRRIDARICLEIGLAFGISALFMCEALADKAGAKFISIDRFQHAPDGFEGMGLRHLQQAGYGDLVEFHGEYSYEVLPRLMGSGVKLDFAYIDSTKVFDVLLVDAFYLSRMLRVGGLLAIDDCHGWAGPKRLARYLAKWPHLKLFDVHGKYVSRPIRKIASTLISWVPHRQHLFSDATLNPAAKLGIDGNCVVFQKVDEDRRHWNWYEHF